MPRDHIYKIKSGICIVRKIKIELCISCSTEHSTGHFDTKITCLAQYSAEILQILSLTSCIIKKLN